MNGDAHKIIMLKQMYQMEIQNEKVNENILRYPTKQVDDIVSCLMEPGNLMSNFINILLREQEGTERSFNPSPSFCSPVNGDPD